VSSGSETLQLGRGEDVLHLGLGLLHERVDPRPQLVVQELELLALTVEDGLELPALLGRQPQVLLHEITLEGR
jgi:hypothetical protein